MGTLHENGDHGQDPGILAAALFELKDFAPAFVAALARMRQRALLPSVRFASAKLAHSAHSKSQSWTHLRAWTGTAACIAAVFAASSTRWRSIERRERVT